MPASSDKPMLRSSAPAPACSGGPRKTRGLNLAKATKKAHPRNVSRMEDVSGTPDVGSRGEEEEPAVIKTKVVTLDAKMLAAPARSAKGDLAQRILAAKEQCAKEGKAIEHQ